MKATQELSDISQSPWLDNIKRGLLPSGTLEPCIRELPLTITARMTQKLRAKIALLFTGIQGF